MAHSLLAQIALLSLVTACLFAFIKGGLAERWGAALISASWFSEYSLSMLFKSLFSQQSLELTLLGTDAALAVGLLILALRFTKLWLGVAMLMQSAELALHGAAMADWGVSMHVYILVNNLLSFSLVPLLISVTAIAWMQRSRAARVAVETPAPDHAPSLPGHPHLSSAAR